MTLDDSITRIAAARAQVPAKSKDAAVAELERLFALDLGRAATVKAYEDFVASLTPSKNFLQGLSAEGTKVLALITSFLAAEGITKLGDGFFAAPLAWADHHGSRDSEHVVLVAVYEGAPDLRRVCSLDGYDYPLNARFQRMLHAAGYVFEEDSHYHGCVFRLP